MACYFSFLILSNRCYYLNFTSISNMYFVDEGKDIELPSAYMDVLTYSLHHEEIQKPHHTAGRRFLLIFSLSKFTCGLNYPRYFLFWILFYFNYWKFNSKYLGYVQTTQGINIFFSFYSTLVSIYFGFINMSLRYL